jgi:hypothetical protein
MFQDLSRAIFQRKISFDTENFNLTTTADILEFCKKVESKQFKLAELQSENVDKQFENNIKLTYLALVSFHIYCANLIEYIPIFETKITIVIYTN